MHGVIFPFGGTTAPNGFLMCDGSAVSRATYAALFSVVGTTFGAGDGSTTFNVPDLRGRVVAGRDNMGGAAAGRLTTAGSGVDGSTLGAAGGAETHTLTVNEMPAHQHVIPSMQIATTAGSTYTLGGANQGQMTNANGSGAAHPITQPTLVMHYIIKT